MEKHITLDIHKMIILKSSAVTTLMRLIGFLKLRRVNCIFIRNFWQSTRHDPTFPSFKDPTKPDLTQSNSRTSWVFVQFFVVFGFFLAAPVFNRRNSQVNTQRPLPPLLRRDNHDSFTA